MAQTANPPAQATRPQFGLRIALGLILVLAAREILSLLPPVSNLAHQVIIGVVGVGLPAAFLHFFDVRRRA